MLRATVRLGRIIAHPDHTGEYAVALEGEIPFSSDDPEGVLEKVAELFHLADEALAREIDRGHEPTQISRIVPKPKSTGAGHAESRSDTATPKQVQYLLNLAKRNNLSRDELDTVIARVTNSPKKVGELTKYDAGLVIDHLHDERQLFFPTSDN